MLRMLPDPVTRLGLVALLPLASAAGPQTNPSPGVSPGHEGLKLRIGPPHPPPAVS
jgi:hypothetical protein